MRARSVGLPLFLAAAAFIATQAHAQAESGSAVPGAAVQPKAPPVKSPYSAKIQKGNAAYLSRDFAGAVAAYRDAIQEAENDPVAFYLLGEAQVGAGNLAEAEATWLSGLGKTASRDDIRAKLLFVLADLRERQGKWPEARKAWEEYAQFVGSHVVPKAYVTTATERTRVIDLHNDLATKYGAVKQRIEQREKEATAQPAPAPEPPKPTTKSAPPAKTTKKK